MSAAGRAELQWPANPGRHQVPAGVPERESGGPSGHRSRELAGDELYDAHTPAAPRGEHGRVGMRDRLSAAAGRAARMGALGALLVTAAVLAPTAAGHAAKVSGVHGDPAALSKTSAQMRLRLKALTTQQDAALSKAERLLSSPISSPAKLEDASDTGANAKAPPTPEFLKPGHEALDFAHGTKLAASQLARRREAFNREADRRQVRARLGRGEDEGRNIRNGPEFREQEVNKREQAQERRDRTSERQRAGLGSEKRALEEAAAFARLTAGARDPRAAAKKRLAQKSEHESYERASNEGLIWKEINQMKHHAEDQTVRVDTSDGLNGEVRELARLSPPKAAQVLAKMSQTDGSAALGALKSIDPEQVRRILAALGQQQQPAQKGGGGEAKGGEEAKPGKPDAHGAPGQSAKAQADGKHALAQTAPPPQFNIDTTDRFDPGESLSFAGKKDSGTFSLSYADNSVMTGYVCKDIVQLGHYYAMTRFGCALDCNDPHFNGIDGILGMGMPDAALPNIPTPLFFAVSNDRGGLEGANYINERPLHTRKFAFLSNSVSGEVQLGGYDRQSTAADMVYVPATSTTEYSVNVQSLTFGGIELLDWVDKTVTNAIPAIMDTGTTCLVIPDTLLGGRVSDRPFSKFKSIMTKGMSFYITIDGHLFEIPYEFWWQRINNSPCVQPTPSSYAGILLGDVVFQSLVVEFDLSKPKAPLIGIAPRNPLYHPVEPGNNDELKIPMIKRHRGHVEILEPDADSEQRHGIDHVPVSINDMRTEYFVNVSVGSPRQTFTVLVDTGSSTLAIFSKLAPTHGRLALNDGMLDRRLKEAKQRLLKGNSAVLAVESGDRLEAHDELRHKEREQKERTRELQTVGDASFEERWAGRSRKEAMELTLPHNVFGSGSSLELTTWSAKPGPLSDTEAEARGAGVVLAAGGTLVLLTSLVALLRLRRINTSSAPLL